MRVSLFELSECVLLTDIIPPSKLVCGEESFVCQWEHISISLLLTENGRFQDFTNVHPEMTRKTERMFVRFVNHLHWIVVLSVKLETAYPKIDVRT